MNWIKNKIAGVLISVANVEKNSFSQENNLLSDDISKHSEKETGTLMNSLKNNIVTQEVMDLRWRTYKILQETDGLTAEIIGYEPDGTPIVKTFKKNHNKGLNKIQLDTFDDYTLEMVIPNDEIVTSGNEMMSSKHLDLLDTPTLNYNEKGELESATHGEINGESYYFSNKAEKPIKINSTNIRRFFLENYTKKINVRNISDNEKLLEFYVSSYPDEYNRTSRLIISEIKKIINDKKKSDILEFDEVEFITYKCIGVNDFLHFKYGNISFDKIVEFNGSYVIKFKATPIVNGHDITIQYKQEELEDKYKNKTKK